MSEISTEQTPSRRGFSGKQVLLFVLLAIVATGLLTFFLLRTYVYASDFRPVELSVKEQRKLDGKLVALGVNPQDLMPDAKRARSDFDADGNLLPQQYSEDDARREIRLSERELNALLANNSDLAKRLAIDLSDNLASARLLVPMDPDFPVLGGKTLRVNAGLEMSFDGQRPSVILRGVSVMGVPIPNAWLGNLKNVDLAGEMGGGGFWSAFADGVEFIDIADGQLHIKLKE